MLLVVYMCIFIPFPNRATEVSACLESLSLSVWGNLSKQGSSPSLKTKETRTIKNESLDQKVNQVN